MKKAIYLLSLAAVSLASCSNDEVITLNQDEIKFAAVTDNASRADINTTTNLEAFKTYAFVEENGTKTYVNGVVANRTEGTSTFELAEKFFWPATPVNFQFVAPTSVDITDGKINNYVCDESNQADLIYAAAINKTKADATEGVLPINFRHALSQLVFKVTSKKEYGLNVTVKEIRIVNVRKGGTLTYPTADTTDPNYSETENGGFGDSNQETELNNNSWGVWSYDENNADEKQSNTYALDVVDMNANANVDNLTADVTAVGKSNYLIMPQQFTKAVVSSTTWTGTSFMLDVVYVKNGVTVYEGWVAVPAVAETISNGAYNNQWKQGKKYIYNFIIGEGGGYVVPDPDPTPDPEPDPTPGGEEPALVPISFTVTVDEYQTVEVPGIDMPNVID